MASQTLVGALRVTLGLDSAAFEGGMDAAEKKLKRSGRNIQRLGQQFVGFGKTMSLAVTAPFIALAATSAKAAMESRDAVAQVEAGLNSMGNAAGRTLPQLEKQAKALQKLSTFDDDDIMRKVTANMLTFGNISGEAFDRAQLAAVDLSTRLKQDLQSSTIMLGKALNDPIAGLSALSRVGISFTAQQKEQIKAMAQAGDVAGAQALMLAELEKQYGGAGKAARDAVPGSDTIDRWRDFQETIGELVLVLGERLLPVVDKVLNAFTSLSPGMQTFVVGGAAVLAVIGPLSIGIGGLISGVGILLPLLGKLPVILGATKIAMAALLSPLGLLVAVLAAATAGIWYFHSANNAARRSLDELSAAAENAEAKADDMEARLKAAGLMVDRVGKASRSAKGEVDSLANAFKAAADRAEELAEKSGLAAIRIAQTGIVRAQQERAPIERILKAREKAFPNRMAGTPVDLQINDNRERIALLKAEEAAFRRQVIAISKAPQIALGGSGSGSGSGSGAGAGVGGPETKGKKGPKAAADRTEQIQERFNSELVSLAQQTLSAQQQLATSAEERAELELRSIELARLNTIAGIDAEKDYSAAQKERLVQQVEAIAEFERAAVERSRQYEIEREALDMARVQFDHQRDMLGFQEQLADTEAERKRVAFEILDLEQEYRRNQLEMVLSSQTASDAEKARAQAILNSLAAIEAGERASVGRSRETQVERYMRGLNLSAGQVNEAIDDIKMKGLDSLNQGLVDAVTGVKSLGKVFRDVANQVIADLLRIAIRKAIIATLGKALFPGGGGGGGGGWTEDTNFLGLATGGSLRIGGNAGIDRNMLSLNGRPIAKVSRGEVLNVRRGEMSGGGGEQVVRIVDTTGLFVTEVERVSSGVVAQAAPSIVRAGGDAGVAKLQRMQNRSLAR